MKPEPPPNPEFKPRALSVKQAARELAVSDKTIRRMIACGKLKTCRFGRAVRIPTTEIDKALNQHVD